jgi:mono/diheme cytochrome c family protein
VSPAVRRTRPLVFLLGLTVSLTGCDDQVKRVPWFKTMFRTVSVQTYEAELTTALLTSPLTRTADVLERGEVLYLQFCVMCHGEEGAGDGPVVGENRLPPLPTLNLLSERAKNDLSDGYIWGMIANGRGVMPSYRRVPHEDRWQIVEYVRELQTRSAGGAPTGSNDTQAGNE